MPMTVYGSPLKDRLLPIMSGSPASRRFQKSLPYLEQIEGVLQQTAKVIEQHIADSPTENDAERDIEDQVIHLRSRDRAIRTFRSDTRTKPAQKESTQVHQSVPAHLQRAEAERNGVDVRIGKHEGGSVIGDPSGG